MSNDESGVPTASMPTGKQSQYIIDHQSTSRVDEDHPIATATIETVSDRAPLLGYPLAAIQAVADQFIDEIESATLVATEGDTEYYCAKSDTFARLVVRMDEEYQREYIQMERLQELMDAHTTQYASDLHGYDGDFEGREKTLCNALNDSTSQEGVISHDTEPEAAHYGFVDSRGLVVQRGTHT